MGNTFWKDVGPGGSSKKTNKNFTSSSMLKLRGEIKQIRAFSLEFRRLWGVLREIYQIYTGKDRVDEDKMFPPIGGPRIKGHNFSKKDQTDQEN